MRLLAKFFWGILGLTLNSTLMATDNIKTPYLFIGEDRVMGRQLWQTDGTETGTQVYRYLQKSPNTDSNPYPLANLPTGAIFSAITNQGLKLWRTDGTPKGTIALPTLINNAYNKVFIPTSITLGTKLLFWTNERTATILNVTDGNIDGTKVLHKFLHQPQNTPETQSPFYVLKQHAYFAIEQGRQNIEWWMTDGSLAGTHRLLDSRQLRVKELSYLSQWNKNIITTKQDLYLLSPNQQNNHGSSKLTDKVLWHINGKTAEKFYEFPPTATPYNLIGIFEDKLFWQVHHQNNEYIELWYISLATRQAKKIYTTKAVNDEINTAHYAKGHLYFSFSNSHDIWVSDLTTQKTHLLAKLSSESIDGINKPQWFNFAGNLYFFNVAGRMQPNHLWVTDGTKAGTQQILHVKDGSCEWSDYLSWNNAPSYYHQLGQNIVFASYKQKSTDCIMQLWGLSAAKPTHPILLGEFDEVILLNPAPNTKLNYLQFLSGNNRWQTDGTQSGTYIIDKEPLRADWQKEEWIAPYGHQLPVLAITNQQEGWLMPDNDQTASGTELWWVSPNPKASYLLKDINTLPASVEGLKNLYRKGTDWYFEIDKQEWMIKADGEKLGSPQLVATLPSNIASTHNETEIAIIENSDHLAPPITKDKDYSEIKKEISLGFIYDGLLTKNSKNQSEQRIQFIWWQPKPNSNRQLIYTKSTEKYFISDITSTQYDIYALGESKLDSKKELLRFDPKNQRFTPVNNFSATPDSKYQPYSIKSISNGIFINGTDNSKDSNINESSKLWFINDKNQQLTLLKQGSTNEKINIMTLKLDKNTCYFDLAHKDGIQEPIELWMSQGTPETTHLMKKGVGFAYP